MQVWFSLLLGWALTGCSGDRVSQNVVASGEVGLQDAIGLVESSKYAEALPLLDKCIDSGGLNADLLSSALVQRAKCHTDAGNVEAAERDLERAEQGSAPLDQFHIARGMLYKKQGKSQQASAEFAKAKKISPKIKIPTL